MRKRIESTGMSTGRIEGRMLKRLADVDMMCRLLIVVNLVLIAAGAYFAVQIFYRVALDALDIASSPRKNIRPVSMARQVSIVPFSHYRHVVERNLFQLKTGAVSKAKQQPLEGLANTDLDIHLWGTVTSKNGTAYAVIESSAGDKRNPEQQLFKEGESVLTATIEKVYRDKVVLEREGELQVLELEKFQSRKSNRFEKVSRPASRPVRPVRLSKSITRKEIERSVQDLNTVMRQAVFRPRSNGLYISRIRRGSIFERLGLRNRDIIYGVDGRKINSVDDALALYNGLKSGSKISLEVRRGGRPVTIDYRIR